ncbi:MAG: alkaline phosphatase family protein, partial [Bacteroidia bacterium]|nr:alkaline phosphatase family protein [Bacteroidia bacterium]
MAALLLSGISSLKAQLGPSNPERTLNRISFGSCNRHNAPQPLWGPIVENNPDLWIWLGDNIYGDTEDMDTLKAKYDAQKSRPEYQALLKTTPVVGIWDDHDYGVNDGGREYSRRVESQQLMLNFLDVPGDAPQRSQMGAYAAYKPLARQV